MRIKLFITYLLLLYTLFTFADTDKYRLILRDDPSTTITIGWNQISGTNPMVYYDTVDHGNTITSYAFTKSIDRTVFFKNMNNQFVRLTGLTPNTNYYFVIGDSEGISQRFWFRTAPDDNSRLSFIAGGDSRNNRDPRQNANLLVSKLKPHAVLFGGDMTDDDTDVEWQRWFDDWQLTIASDGRMFPIVPARGNHEDDVDTIYKLFDTPNVDSYYAITFGADLIRTYTLNTEISVLGDQTTWLENDLIESASVTWKMAQYHKPMRPHTGLKQENNNQYTAWANLFYDNDVRLVVDCDSHLTKTTWPVKPSFEAGNDEGFVIDQENGTVYTGEGGWGAPLRFDDDPKSWTRNSGSFNQFKLIFVEPSKIELRTINVNNASSVSEVSNTDPFTLPSALNVFSPSTGAVITIDNNALASCPPMGSPCDDGDASTVFDEEDGACNCVGLDENLLTVTTAPILISSDDAEEVISSGAVNLLSTDLELGNDNGNNQLVGIRFDNINIPDGSTLVRAYIQFETDEISPIPPDPTDLVIHGELALNSNTFEGSDSNISSRSLTSNSATWENVEPWGNLDQASYSQRSPAVTNIVNEIISQNGWVANNSITFIVSGTGKRVAKSFETSVAGVPKLLLYYYSNCPITSITLGAQGACNDFDDTYSQDLIVEFNDAPSAGTLHLNGQNFPIGTSPQTITLTGLNADGLDVEVVAFFTDEANCIYANKLIFEAPSKCSLNGIPDNSPNDNINLALLSDATLSGSVENGRGTPETILYNPEINNYQTITTHNEYGVNFEENLGKPGIEDAFKWQVNWLNAKYINYITFGGAFDNQPQPNTLWRISYRSDGVWTTLEEGQGGWIDSGIFEWGDATFNPIKADALRVQLYSDGLNDLVSIHLRGRGGTSTNSGDDSATTPKATLIQYLSPGNACDINLNGQEVLYCGNSWINGNGPSDNTGALNIIIGDGTYIINEDEIIQVNDFEILTGATVIIKEGASLSINGNFINNGNLNLESISTKYSSLIINGTSTGNVSYNRHVNAFNGITGNDLVASPFMGQTFGDFANANTTNLYESPIAGNSDQKLFGPFDEPSGNYINYSSIDDNGVILKKGIGYRAASNATIDAENGTPLKFKGEVETAGFSIPITASVSAFSGWNLIGNPYPSYLDFETFFNLNKEQLEKGTYQAVYGYDGDATNGWTILNNLSSNVLIAPGQGFFVKSKTNGGMIEFTPAMRAVGNSDDFIDNRTVELKYVKLSIDNTSKSFETDIYFNENTTMGLDSGYDASLFGGSAPNFSIYTHLVEQNTVVPMAIQAVGENDMNNVSIPLGIHASQGETLTVTIADISIPSSIYIYLEDKDTNLFTLLNEQNYTFTTQKDIDQSGRFVLHFENQSLSTTEELLNKLSIYTERSKKAIVIEGQLQENSTFKLYDINGRIVTVKDLEASSGQQTINVGRINSGIYIVQIDNGLNEKRIQKIVIE